jgi:co-chaperonin GroES (HSP10)
VIAFLRRAALMGRRLALALFVAFASHCACFSVGGLAARITSPRVLPPQAYASTIESGEELQPLEDHIVIDLQSAPSATVAGILLPTVFEDEQEDEAFAKPEPRAGTVLAVGPGALTKNGNRAPMPDIKVGQKVVVGPKAGIRIQLKDKPLRESTIFLFKAEEIWAVCS